jgi:hypothetical protein
MSTLHLAGSDRQIGGNGSGVIELVRAIGAVAVGIAYGTRRTVGRLSAIMGRIGFEVAFKVVHDRAQLSGLEAILLQVQPAGGVRRGADGGSSGQVVAQVIEINQVLPLSAELALDLIRNPGRAIPSP